MQPSQGMGRRNGLESLGSVEPEGDEFISSLAASMGLQLIVEVSPEPSQSMVCILLEQAAAKLVIQELGLEDRMEYKVGNPYQLLPEYKNFSFIDCKADRYPDLLRLLDINLRRSVVAANRLEGGKEGLRVAKWSAASASTRATLSAPSSGPSAAPAATAAESVRAHLSTAHATLINQYHPSS